VLDNFVISIQIYRPGKLTSAKFAGPAFPFEFEQPPYRRAALFSDWEQRNRVEEGLDMPIVISCNA